MILNHLHYLKVIFLIMTLFVDIYTRLLCHMSPINITMQVLQKMLKISNYLWTYMQVLQWM